MQDSQRILAPGRVVELVDGTPIHLRFDFAAMMRLEDRFGSLVEFVRKLDAQWSADGFRTVHAAMEAAGGAPIDVALLETTKWEQYHTAVLEAWLEAVPPPNKGKDSGQESDSTGEPTGESPSVSESPQETPFT